MLTDYFEPFTLLKSAFCPDPCGGQLQQDVTELPFRAALADALGEEGERERLKGSRSSASRRICCVRRKRR